MTRFGLVCLLFCGYGVGASSQFEPHPVDPAVGTPAANPAETKKEAEASNVPPDTPVITINGVCPNPPADKASDQNCKTVITRAGFRKNPGCRPAEYAPACPAAIHRMVMADKAHEMGFGSGPKYEQRLNLARVQILSQALNQAVQEKAGQISDQDIEDYYHNNTSAYEEADLQRIFIPHSQTLPALQDQTGPGG